HHGQKTAEKRSGIWADFIIRSLLASFRRHPLSFVITGSQDLIGTLALSRLVMLRCIRTSAETHTTAHEVYHHAASDNLSCK
ncbi:MAG: hypothetical protein ACO3RS_06445, partial [Candidatus Puniceispirillaceae bacterium]